MRTGYYRNISTSMIENRNHDLQYLKSDSSDDFLYRGNSHKKTQNTLQTSGNTGVDLDIPPRFPVVDLVENVNKKYQANSRLIENRQKKDFASLSQDEDDFPALQFMEKNAQVRFLLHFNFTIFLHMKFNILTLRIGVLGFELNQISKACHVEGLLKCSIQCM